MAKVGQLPVDVLARTPGLQKGLKKGQQSMQQFKKVAGNIAAGIAAAFSINAIRNMIDDFAETGDMLQKMSLRTGLSVEALSGLKFAAEQSGASIETLETGVRNMQRVLLDVQQGSSTAATTLSMLGLSISQLQTMSPEQQFLQMATAISRVKDPSKQAALAMELFGRSGTQLLPMLQQGEAGIAKLVEEAKNLGIIMSTENANVAADYVDAMNRLKKSMREIGFALARIIVPALTMVANLIASMGPMLTNLATLILTWTGTFLTANAAIKVMVGLFRTVGTILTSIATKEAFIAGLRQNWVGIAAGITASVATAAVFANQMSEAETSTKRMAMNMQDVEEAVTRAGRAYQRANGFSIRSIHGPGKPAQPRLSGDLAALTPVIRHLSMQEAVKQRMDEERNKLLQDSNAQHKDATKSLRHIAAKQKRKDIDVNKAASF